MAAKRASTRWPTSWAWGRLEAPQICPSRDLVGRPRNCAVLKIAIEQVRILIFGRQGYIGVRSEEIHRVLSQPGSGIGFLPGKSMKGNVPSPAPFVERGVGLAVHVDLPADRLQRIEIVHGVGRGPRQPIAASDTPRLT